MTPSEGAKSGEAGFGRGDLLAGLALAALTAIQVLLITRTLGDWWFEDDTPHLVFVREHGNPLAYFFTRELIRELSLGQAVTPWFPFTFWIDRQIEPLSPGTAYLHTAVSLWLTAWLGYALLKTVMDRRYALGAASIWLFLSSTVVITEFLSTRHYLEGLALSLAALLCASRATRTATRHPLAWCLAAGALYLLATTAKEVFVTATWFWLMWMFWRHRHRVGMLVIFISGLIYTGYRFWGLGTGGKALGLDFVARVPRFLARLPFILTGWEGGYALAAVALILTLWLLWRRRMNRWHLLFFLASAAVLLGTIFPVARHLDTQFRATGTWYRLAFLMNGFWLFCLIWLIHRLDRPRLGAFLMAGLAGISLWGGTQTARRWDDLKASYNADAAFYLAFPGRLLYSRLPATWFLHGVHELYRPGSRKHYLTPRIDFNTPAAYILEQTGRYPAVWDSDGTVHLPDTALLATIHANAEAGTMPLHQPLETEEADETETTDHEEATLEDAADGESDR